MSESRGIDLVKIVYFDEGSATDFVQLKNGGSLMAEVETTESSSKDGQAGADAKAGIRGGIVGLLRGSAEVQGSIAASFRDGTVVKSVITNTVLTDFLNAVNEQGDCSVITQFDRLRIVQIPGSISSLSLLTPYFSMIKSGQSIPAGDLNISVDKLDSTLSKAKGYFEFLGTEDEEPKVILRFNGLGFKNNYKQGNLLNMHLKLYAVRVGETRLSELSADNELRMEGFSKATNPDYVEEVSAKNVPPVEEKELPMYDVILAGVSVNGN